MEEVYKVKSLKELKALANPKRIQILKLLVESPKSAKEVADELGEPQNKIHYHLKELQRAGLIRVEGEKRKGNLIERLFRSRAKFFTVDWSLFQEKTKRREALLDTLSSVLEVGLLELRKAADAGLVTDKVADLAIPLHSTLTVKKERLLELRGTFERFLKSLREFQSEDGVKVSLTLLLLPLIKEKEV
jgi:DNA-binding transcriptional ArsR family regulator